MNYLQYEDFVKCLVEEMQADSSVEVHHQRQYRGRVSGRDIKIDISFEVEVIGSRILVLVECKNYKKKVPVDDVEEFHSKIDDIGAHKGIIVTTEGYQDGAIKTAKGRGIALALLTKDRLRGEIVYVVDAAAPPRPPTPSANLFQGNFKVWGDWWGGEREGGFRFESFRQLWSILALGMYEQRRLRRNRQQRRWRL